MNVPRNIDRFEMDLWTLCVVLFENLSFRPLVVLNAPFFSSPQLFFSSQLFVLNNGLNDFNLWPNGRNGMHKKKCWMEYYWNGRTDVSFLEEYSDWSFRFRSFSEMECSFSSVFRNFLADLDSGHVAVVCSPPQTIKY